MILPKNIRYLRKKYNLSQDKLAEILGYKSFTTIQKWESGVAEPPLKTLSAIAKYFKVDINDLANIDLEFPTTPSASTPAIRIPVYGKVPAGIPLEAIEDILDYEELKPEMAIGGKEFFALKVVGDSMTPKYIDGDIIILEKCVDCESGTDCVVYVNGYDATLKKIIKKIDGIVLQPLNSAYEPMFYSYNDEDYPINIIGKVVEIRRKV